MQVISINVNPRLNYCGLKALTLELSRQEAQQTCSAFFRGKIEFSFMVRVKGLHKRDVSKVNTVKYMHTRSIQFSPSFRQAIVTVPVESFLLFRAGASPTGRWEKNGRKYNKTLSMLFVALMA